MNHKYTPFYAEEIFIANCYGTEEEILRFNDLMGDPGCKDNTVQLILLIENIKERHRLTMGWDCCWRCQHYQSCEINWRRGEMELSKHCCPNCRNYADCSRIAMAEKLALKALESVRASSPGNGNGGGLSRLEETRPTWPPRCKGMQHPLLGLRLPMAPK
ncbi:MAG: hypothetical protein HY814_00950 [Candidatus Riflebacteria bacterium]|nr:hypothetical protein [Candidatus Riflebacteria bacterium]